MTQNSIFEEIIYVRDRRCIQVHTKYLCGWIGWIRMRMNSFRKWHLIVRLGLLTRILHLIQEIVLCNGNSNAIEPLGTLTNCYHEIHVMHDHSCLTKRFHINNTRSKNEEDNVSSENGTTTDDNKDVSIVISKEEERSSHRQNL